MIVLGISFRKENLKFECNISLEIQFDSRLTLIIILFTQFFFGKIIICLGFSILFTIEICGYSDLKVLESLVDQDHDPRPNFPFKFSFVIIV